MVSKFQEEDLNAAFVINFTGANSKGENFAIGKEAKLNNQAHDFYEGDRRVTYMYPLDIFKTIGDKISVFSRSNFLKRRNEPIEIVTEKDCKTILPPGSWSYYLSIILLIPPEFKGIAPELLANKAINFLLYFNLLLKSNQEKLELICDRLDSFKAFVGSTDLSSELSEQFLNRIALLQTQIRKTIIPPEEDKDIDKT